MSKIVLIIAFLILTFHVFGKDVSIEQAMQIAEKFLNSNTAMGLKNASVYEIKDAGDIFQKNYFSNTGLKSAYIQNRDLYAFNLGESGGFVIVSGDDAAIPILGYSETGHINPLEMPQNVLKWLEGYKQQIQFIKANQIEQSEESKTLWNDPANRLKSAHMVVPLIKTQWNQNPYYNDKCPFDRRYNERTVTGCPATAMAQIMKYWEYPKKGIGFHSYQHKRYGMLSANFSDTYYDWEAMPTKVTSYNDAVATLMYHCGVAVEMEYNVGKEGGSGSQVIIDPTKYRDNFTVENALLTYFGYDSNIKGLYRAGYTDNEWKAILKAELDAGRPIQYAGYGQGGHTFVCDGYDTGDYFHMNWGWGGQDDGYYLLDALEPSNGGTGAGARRYNDGQQALIGIKPPDALQSYELKINDDVTINQTTIAYGEAFEIVTDIKNAGTNIFNGDYCAAIFDINNVFIDSIDTKIGVILNGGYHYTNGISFTTEGMLSLLPGDYNIFICYRPTGGSWNVIKPETGDTGTKYIARLKVINENTLSLYSEMKVQTETIYTNDSLSVWLDVANYDESDFAGSFVLSLYDQNGEYVTTVEEKTNMNLPSNCHYEGGVTFSTDNLEVEPGTYFLALMHQKEGAEDELTGSSGTFINPIKIIVQQAPYEMDMYENNDSISQSFVLTANYANDNAQITTKGSNIHVGNDWDFYAVNLEAGYDYQVDIQLHDTYSGDQENNYSVDGLFLYSLDGVNWSTTYDDGLEGKINAAGNSTLYCIVSPYFLGETGTYLLDFQIERKIVSNNASRLDNAEITVYPNPCKDMLTVSGSHLEDYTLSNLSGQVVKSGQFNNRRMVDISHLTKGIYLMTITSNGRKQVRKILKE